MSEPVLQMIEVQGLRMHVAIQGSGPVVLLCHGFPEGWSSWRHQIRALAEAGYRAVAPDMRGYGHTDRPSDIGQYAMTHLVGDMVGLLDRLEAKDAVIIGHDWGAPVAWHAALWRPDRFRAVGGLSVPFYPRSAAPPSTRMPETKEAVFYQTYFMAPGIAEAEFERDIRSTLRKFQVLWSGNPTAASGGQRVMVPRQGGFLTDTPEPGVLPAWVTEADIDAYTAAFQHSGFRGPLNWYRNIDRNWEQMAPWQGVKLTTPALYMIGDRDPVLTFRRMDRLIPGLEHAVPGLREKHIIPNCGHWIQREQPDAVNTALLRFLGSLPS